MEKKSEMKAIGFVVSVFVLGVLAFVVSAEAQVPLQPPGAKATPGGTACQITSINLQTGMVGAKLEATGQTLEFKVNNVAALRSLKVGQQVYADVAKREVSLDGKTACCAIVSVTAAATAGAPTANAKAAGAGKASAPLTPGAKPGQIAFLAPKVSIAEQANISVLAKAEHDEWALKRLNAVVEGKAVQVDYYHLRGIEGIQKAEGLPPAVRDVLLAHASQLKPCALPVKASGGAGKPVPPAMVAQANCEDIPFYVVNKRVAEEWANTHPPLSKTASGAPTTFAQPSERKIAQSASGNGKFMRAAYAEHRNAELQPQIPSAKDLEKKAQKAAGDVAKDVSKDVQHAEDQISGAAQRAQGLTGKWAKHWQQEATKDWEKVEDCWADHAASHKQNFHINPKLGFDVNLASMPAPLPNIGQGTINFQLPIDVKFQAEASVFYIPCAAITDVATGGIPLPFVVRPRDLAVGEVGSDGEPIPDKGYISYGASLNTNIQYIAYPGEKVIDIKPASLHMDPTIPILPPTVVMAGPVPIEFSIYLYLRGRINIGGEAAIESNYSASSTKEGPFWFVCDGKGCRGDFSKVQGETTTLSGPGVAPKKGGRLFVEPAFWTALQLDLYNGILMARGGPEPAIAADVWGFDGSGCGTSGAATQTGLGSDNVRALTADIDANLYAPWEVRVLGTTDPYTGNYPSAGKHTDARDSGWPSFLSPSGKPLLWQKHLYFRDLAGSTAVGPLVSPNGAAGAGHPAAYRIKMRPCYPYKDEVEYAVKWGDGQSGSSKPGTATPTALGASVRSIGGTTSNGDTSMWGSPQQDIVVNHTWTEAGQFTIQVIPLRDKHGRTFDASAVSQLIVNVPVTQSSSAKP
jgi:hypothetical protein